MSITLPGPGFPSPFENPPVPEAPPVRRGHPLLAWLVILAAVAFVVVRNRSASPADRERFDLVLMEVEARLFVGWAHLPGQTPALVFKQVQALDRGPYAQRLRFAVVAGELAGPAEARARLHALNTTWARYGLTPPPELSRVAGLLDRLYAGYERESRKKKPPAPALSVAEQEEVRRQLGWFGRLALAPEGGDPAARDPLLTPARRAAVGALSFGLLMLLVFLVGGVLLVLMFVLWIAGRLRGGLAPGPGGGGIYAETFALYLVLFLALSYAAAWFSPPVHLRLLVSGLAALASLAALAWPVARGIPWARVRQDVGWVRGREPSAEPLVGLGCYAAALPLVLVGLGVSTLLRKLQDMAFGPVSPFGPSDTPVHPLPIYIARSGWPLWLQAFFVASVVAPVVEETMFRGVLYRHLREASAGAGRVASVLGSALVSSLVFAAIHPQGLTFVPVLMALALAFALAREWRGTLVPSMVAHGVNNAAVTALLILMAA